jgi:hypothetical protein
MVVTVASVPIAACVFGDPPTACRVIIKTPAMLMKNRTIMT